MRWILLLLSAVGLAAVSDGASAQRYDSQGPVLIVPRSNVNQYREGAVDPYGQFIRRGETTSQWRSGDPDRYGWSDRRYGHDEHDHDHGHDHGGYRGPLRYSDPQMQQVSDWYRQFLGRNLKPNEEQQWRNHLAQARPGQEQVQLHGVLATILGSEEYYDRIGGRFSDWTAAVSRDTGRPISREEALDWNNEYRRARDRIAVRIGLVKHLVAEHQQVPIVAPDYRYEHGRSNDRFVGGYRDDRRYGYSSYGPRQPELPWYARGAERDHDHAHDHEHGEARPAGNADSATISGWYRAYLGRQIKPEELQDWLGNRARGMSLEQVRAAIFSSQEWYGRTGGTPEQWTAATLNAIGRRGDPGLQAYWLDRFQQLGGDRYKTAMEMIQKNGEPDRRSRRDRRDDDD